MYYDSEGSETGEDRIIRGGSWNNSDYEISSGKQGWYAPYRVSSDEGFRVARSAQ
jgi:formylglycine-generating enzyme required for sulfatase activity